MKKLFFFYLFLFFVQGSSVKANDFLYLRRIRSNDPVVENALRLGNPLPLIKFVQPETIPRIKVSHPLGITAKLAEDKEKGKVLEISYGKKEAITGEVNVSIDLSNLPDNLKKEITKNPYTHLAFEIKGKGESPPTVVKLRLSFANGKSKEIIIGGLHDFFLGKEEKISGSSWLKVILPLKVFALEKATPEITAMQFVFNRDIDSDGKGAILLGDISYEAWKDLGIEEGIEEPEVTVELGIEKYFQEKPSGELSFEELARLTGMDIEAVKKAYIEMNVNRISSGLETYEILRDRYESVFTDEDFIFAFRLYEEKNGAPPTTTVLGRILSHYHQTAVGDRIERINFKLLNEGKEPLIIAGRTRDKRGYTLPRDLEIQAGIEGLQKKLGRAPTLEEVFDLFYPERLFVSKQQYESLKPEIQKDLWEKIISLNEERLRENLFPLKIKETSRREEISFDELEIIHDRLKTQKGRLPTIQEIADYEIENQGVRYKHTWFAVAKALLEYNRQKAAENKWAEILQVSSNLEKSPLRTHLSPQEIQEAYISIRRTQGRDPTVYEIAKIKGASISAVIKATAEANHLFGLNIKFSDLGWTVEGVLDEEIYYQIKQIKEEKGKVTLEDLLARFSYEGKSLFTSESLRERIEAIRENFSLRGGEEIIVEGLDKKVSKGITEAEVQEVTSAYWTYIRDHQGKIPRYGDIAQILNWPVARLAKNMIRINTLLQSKGEPSLYFQNNWPENFANSEGVFYAYQYYMAVFSKGELPSLKDLALMTGYSDRGVRVVIDALNLQRKKYGLPNLEIRKED